MGKFGRGRLAILAGLLGVAAFGVAPVAADTGGGGGAPFTITINPTGTVTRLGIATISGTITCDQASGTVSVFDLFGGLIQPVGRLNSVQGGSQDLTTLTCTAGTPTPWSLAIIPSGKFVAGSATALVSGDGCDDLTCGGTQSRATIKLGR